MNQEEQIVRSRYQVKRRIREIIDWANLPDDSFWERRDCELFMTYIETHLWDQDRNRPATAIDQAVYAIAKDYMAQHMPVKKTETWSMKRWLRKMFGPRPDPRSLVI